MKCTYASKEQKKQLISIVERIGIFLVKEAYERDNIKEINELEYLWEKASKTADIIKIILSNEIPLRTYKAIGSMFEVFTGTIVAIRKAKQNKHIKTQMPKDKLRKWQKCQIC